MPSPVLVTGGTGRLGRLVVPRLRDAGCDVLAGLRRLARLPVVPVPAGFLVQPIDPDEVAARLVDLALGEPAGRVPDMGGPQAISWADLLRGYLRASQRRPLAAAGPDPRNPRGPGRRPPATASAPHRRRT